MKRWMRAVLGLTFTAGLITLTTGAAYPSAPTTTAPAAATRSVAPEPAAPAAHSSELAFTGADIGELCGLAVVLGGGGAALVVVSRRRRQTPVA